MPAHRPGSLALGALADPALVGLSEKEARIAKEKELGVYKEHKVGASWCRGQPFPPSSVTAPGGATAGSGAVPFSLRPTSLATPRMGAAFSFGGAPVSVLRAHPTSVPQQSLLVTRPRSCWRLSCLVWLGGGAARPLTE